MASRASAALLESWFPWARTPLIVGAPMRTVSGPSLTAAVSAAGGLGFLGIGYEPEDLAATLQACRDLLPAKLLKEQLLPIGVGFLTWNCSHEVAISGLLSNPPRAVWLFGIASTAELGTWCNAVRSNLPSTLIFYQGGSLEDITAAIELTAPGDKRPLIDAIVVQSSDAGGHGFARGASLMTLLPEVKDSIVEMKRTGKIPHDRVIPLLAAGGIMDSRGVAAVLALGADAAVLGTRLIATEESEAPDTFKELLVQAVDGGQTTARSTLFDTLRGHGDWPPVYDGRAIVNKSYVEAELQGVSLEIVKERYQTAVQEGDFQRVAAYAGTGIGLIRNICPAKELVEEARGGAGTLLASLAPQYI